jgi:hypothetical protein
MKEYFDAIKHLRDADKGENGPLEAAAKCIEFLVWENRKFKERLSWFDGVETPTDIASKKHAGAARHWFKSRRPLK